MKQEPHAIHLLGKAKCKAQIDCLLKSWESIENIICLNVLLQNSYMRRNQFLKLCYKLYLGSFITKVP